MEPMTDNLQLKKLAADFLTLTAAGRVDEAFSAHVGPDFIHHNQYYKGDGASIKAGMKENALKFTDKVFEVKTALQDGDKVVTYSHMTMNPGHMQIAVFHMFKFEHGKIIEMWDVGQKIEDNSPNENGMF
jgi:predicted SnoaL-like aldol condensation-catalyzing enzyme